MDNERIENLKKLNKLTNAKLNVVTTASDLYDIANLLNTYASDLSAIAFDMYQTANNIDELANNIEDEDDINAATCFYRQRDKCLNIPAIVALADGTEHAGNGKTFDDAITAVRDFYNSQEAAYAELRSKLLPEYVIKNEEKGKRE
jgi:hypothetical protein